MKIFSNLLYSEDIVEVTDSDVKDIVLSEVDRLGNSADLNHIDLSDVTNLRGLFYKSNFNGDISQWDVSNVEDMELMFAYSKFNGDISKWDVSNVDNMSNMFKGSSLEKNPPKWYNG